MGGMRQNRPWLAVPLAAVLLLPMAWPSHASAASLFFGDIHPSSVEVDSAAGLKDAIESGATHILLTDHIDTRGARGSSSSNSTFVLQSDVVIQGECTGGAPDFLDPSSAPPILRPAECVIVTDSTLFAISGPEASVSLNHVYLRMQRTGAAAEADVPLLSVTSAALWITSSTLQGDDGVAVALSLVYDAQAFISGSAIQGWRSGVAPVAVIGRNASLALDDCDVTDNLSTGFLPAIYVSSDMTATPSAVVVRGARIARDADPFFGTWLPGAARFYSDADPALRVLRVEENSEVPALPLADIGGSGAAEFLEAGDDPLLAGAGDIASTDDASPDAGLDQAVPAPRGGFVFSPFSPDDSLPATDAADTPPTPDPTPDPSLDSPAATNADSDDPGRTAVAAVAVEAPEGERQNSLLTALLATFGVLACSVVVLIAVVAILAELRRRRKKQWLRCSDEHQAPTGTGLIEAGGSLNQSTLSTVGLPTSSRPGERSTGDSLRPWSLSRFMFVANAAFDPQLTPRGFTVRRMSSAAHYAHAAEAAAAAVEGEDAWEGGYGAQCTTRDAGGVFANPLAPPEATGALAGHTIVDGSEYDSDSSSLDFDMRGMNALQEMSNELGK